MHPVSTGVFSPPATRGAFSPSLKNCARKHKETDTDFSGQDVKKQRNYIALHIAYFDVPLSILFLRGFLSEMSFFFPNRSLCRELSGMFVACTFSFSVLLYSTYHSLHVLKEKHLTVSLYSQLTSFRRFLQYVKG